jgi:hypothetical protein
MNLTATLSVAAPILIAIIGGFFGYRQAVKVADRNTGVEGRKLNLQGYESLNSALQTELDKQRSDEERLEVKVATLETRLEALETARREDAKYYVEVEFALQRAVTWARHVQSIIGDPAVESFLSMRGYNIPHAPLGIEAVVRGRRRED